MIAPSLRAWYSPSLYALQSLGNVENHSTISGISRRPSSLVAGRAFIMLQSGSTSSGSSSSECSTVLEVDVRMLGSRVAWTTREVWIISLCNGKRESPAIREYAGSLGPKLKSVQRTFGKVISCGEAGNYLPRSHRATNWLKAALWRQSSLLWEWQVAWYRYPIPRELDLLESKGEPYPFIRIPEEEIRVERTIRLVSGCRPDLGCQKRCVVATIMPSASLSLLRRATRLAMFLVLKELPIRGGPPSFPACSSS